MELSEAAVAELNGQNPFVVAQQQCDDCANILNIDLGVREIIREPMQEIHVSIPVRMDDGSIRVFKGFRVIHNTALGPAKGGIRFHPDETVDTVKALAAWMTWKCSLLELPLGGGKGGVICNPKEMSPGELERLSRGYVDRVWQFIGPDKDIPAPDVYTNPQIMAWMMDQYSKIAGKNQFGVITGKPLRLGGSAGRHDATARGGLYVLREAARTRNLNLKGATMAVQGFGNAGSYVASLARELFGCRIVAVSDSRGAVYNRMGLNPQLLSEHKRMTGSVADYPKADPLPQGELLELDVDVLCPCSLENVITSGNAQRIKASIVAEFANGPTTPEADEIFYAKDVHLLPDFLCNAGGVTVSYFEMVQNFNMFYWDEKEVYERLDNKMTAAYYSVLDISRKYGVNMRRAAYIVAVRRVAEAMQLRGWV
ncbi:MAG: Glu/Leu/Phe/Val dehydrogenase [Bacillota bacterium]